jgi:hypothetical protein
VRDRRVTRSSGGSVVKKLAAFPVGAGDGPGFRLTGVQPGREQGRAAPSDQVSGGLDQLHCLLALADLQEQDGLLSHRVCQQRWGLGLAGGILRILVVPPCLAYGPDVQCLPAC